MFHAGEPLQRAILDEAVDEIERLREALLYLKNERQRGSQLPPRLEHKP